MHSIGDPREPVMATFKNADHKIVFQAQAAALVYVRHADVTGKVDLNAAPGQVRDMQAELAQQPSPVQVGMNTGYIPGGAGGTQVFTLNVPAGGLA